MGIEQLFNDADIMRAERRADEAVESAHGWKRRADTAEAACLSIASSHAANIALLNALQEQLRLLDPKNPVLVEPLIREKIRELGERAFAVNENFDDARNVGLTFRVPRSQAVE